MRLGVSPPPIVNGDLSDDGEGPSEKWNAVCVVGLRVYSTLSGEKVKLKVVRPRHDEDDSDSGSGSDNKPDGEKTAKDDRQELKLDPDDISKGAVAAVPESTGVDLEEGEKVEIRKGDEMKLGRKMGLADRRRKGARPC